MKKSFFTGVQVVGLLLALAGSASRAVAKEPTIDERFRDTKSSATNNASESELPLLSAPQSRLAQPTPDLVRPNSNTGNISGPAYFGVTFSDNERSAVVRSVAPGSPAEQAGLKRGDIIAGVNGEKTRTLSELYRKMWALGAAGVTVPLDVLSDSEPRRVDVNSVNRLDTLKLQSTF